MGSSFNGGVESYVQDNSLPTLTFKMQLAINKIKPYLSSIKDLPNLIKRLEDLGVECVDDLKLLNFENDLQGIMKVIQCRKLKLELFKDVIKDENIGSPSVELESSPLTQSNTLHRLPQFRSVTKSEETERKLENQFPNATQNRESEFNVEHTSNSMLQSVDHLKRKQSPEQNQQGSSHQNHKDAIETSNQKKFRFATHQDRYAPTILLDAETISVQDQNKTWLKTLYIVNYVTNVSNRNNISWDNINSLMKNTYANQRAMIVNSEPIAKILMDWPFLGKAENFKNHFYYLINKKETVIDKFNKKIPTILKFIQAEAEKNRKNKALQLKLMAIMKINYDKNELLTVLLFYMSILKENPDLMFIIFKETISLDELQSNAKINSTPVVVCLGDIWSNPKCFVFVDKQCLWKHEPLTIQEAIQIMFMSYYVFNINYPKELAGILQFIQSCMFDINIAGNKINRRISDDVFVPTLQRFMKEYNEYVLKWSH